MTTYLDKGGEVGLRLKRYFIEVRGFDGHEVVAESAGTSPLPRVQGVERGRLRSAWHVGRMDVHRIRSGANRNVQPSRPLHSQA